MFSQEGNSSLRVLLKGREYVGWDPAGRYKQLIRIFSVVLRDPLDQVLRRPFLIILKLAEIGVRDPEVRSHLLEA